MRGCGSWLRRVRDIGERGVRCDADWPHHTRTRTHAYPHHPPPSESFGPFAARAALSGSWPWPNRDAATSAKLMMHSVVASTLKSYAAAWPILIIILRCHPAEPGSAWKEATPPRAEMTASAGIELFELLCPKTSEPRAGHMEPRGAGQ